MRICLRQVLPTRLSAGFSLPTAVFRRGQNPKERETYPVPVLSNTPRPARGRCPPQATPARPLTEWCFPAAFTRLD